MAVKAIPGHLGGTPLDDVMRSETASTKQVVEYLESKGAKQGNGRALFSLPAAAAAGDVERLRQLCTNSNVNQGDYDNRTACHLAASEGHLAALKCLIEEFGADSSPLDRWHHTPLDDARRHAHEDVCEYLEGKKARHGKAFRERRLTPGSSRRAR